MPNGRQNRSFLVDHMAGDVVRSMQSISTDLWHLLHNHDQRFTGHKSLSASVEADGNSQSSSPQWSQLGGHLMGKEHTETTFEGHRPMRIDQVQGEGEKKGRP